MNDVNILIEHEFTPVGNKCNLKIMIIIIIVNPVIIIDIHNRMSIIWASYDQDRIEKNSI